MNLYLTYTPHLVHPLWIVTWKVGWPCVSLHVCPSHPTCGPKPCLECVHASVHKFMSTWLLRSGPPHMHSLMETWVPLYGSVFVSQSSHFCCHTLFRMCTCISTWIYVYLTPHVWSTPLWIVTWKVGCLCVSLCLCPIHPCCGPTACLECVHASVHEFMSTWLLMSGPPPLHSLMEIWVPLYGSVFVYQSSHFCCPTLYKMCTCISTWIYVYLTAHMSGPPPMDSYMEIWVPLCVTACVSQSPYFCSYTLFTMCTCINTWIYVYVTPHVWSTPYGNLHGKLGAPVYHFFYVPFILVVVPHLV